ncbi:type IV pilin protein [Schinkia azotoformans]|uniref:type IV pilin protein n=1 Tax=Schinkia azotoformans TaxID=1454 RepID=UPI002DBE0280|nr:prepilin-type N-terminal cleavage/methylation domain-containing protein [Schinkia azotoformans]MEC1742086.1 prepilin-type N-terminal cleavage/methylation domain-containing protein [Schinkia azotoformans]MEC1765026.1 prepilin-type N-terminal cleavage/methylation domain-containing protein [Schinkia azotoformans]MEC1785952.1 prepilin-type N-terminal cleavage/methylation domain-containing protein [Schinkia azotoformans]MED4419719.1 prepilin-type N-terminal cleavage/methylation domain-containing 
MLKRFLKNEKGLTLIELLAVVVILGVIAAIAVPAIGKIIEDSKNKAVVSDALQIINAAKIAKANNPNETTFIADGTKGNATTPSQELDDYLDTQVKATTTVTYTTGGKWEIDGHTDLAALKTKLGSTNDPFSTKPLEEELVNFLDGKTKKTTTP